MKQKWKRPLALLLSVAMMFSMSGTPVYAAAMETGASAVCPHHVHDETCGYSEGTPCTHEHTDDCYTLVTQCVHEHTAECYSDGLLPAEGEEKEADACTHVCSEESGCITKELNCPHVHDETCGYSEGSPCTFDPADCELCNFQENPAGQTILSWEWIGADNLNEGVLPLPDVSAENPVDLDAVVSMLPTGITATVDGSADPVELALTWSCGDFPETASAGEYTFTAALPEGYTLGEETASLTAPVILGLGLLPVTALAMVRPCWAARASEISLAVTAPNRRPPSPALAATFTVRLSSFLARASASAFSAASWALRAFSCCFMVLILSAVAETASFRGRRKLRAYPSDTSTIWPFLPWPLTSCCKITFMLCSSKYYQ